MDIEGLYMQDYTYFQISDLFPEGNLQRVGFA